MTDQTLPAQFADKVLFTIPEFGVRPVLVLDFSKIREGEDRLIEAKVVNPGTYNELEYVYNEGYREAVKNLSVVGYEITQAKKRIRQVKSEKLIDDYPTFLKEKGLKDNTAMREAFLERCKDFVAASDRLDMLIALESLLDGKIKVFTNVCRYMKKEIFVLFAVLYRDLRANHRYVFSERGGVYRGRVRLRALTQIIVRQCQDAGSGGLVHR